MSDTVTVALLGNPEHAFDSQAFTWREDGADELDKPWDELPKVTVEVEDGDSLYRILATALRESGIKLPYHVDPDHPPIAWILFRSEGAQPAPRRFLYTLNVIDDDGRVRWSQPFGDVTFGQAKRAADGGVLPGNPREMYLILLPPQGDGMLVTWSSLLEGLRIAWDLMGVMAQAGGAVAFASQVLRLARGRLERGREAIQEHYLDWSERGARPDNFADVLVIGAPWHRADLAERLGCTEDAAESILWSYGFEPDASGLWRVGKADAARLLQMLNEDLAATQASNPGESFEREMKRRATGLLEQGQPMPEPRPEPEEYIEDEPSQLTMGEAIGGLRVGCQCGQPDCSVEVEFYRSGDYQDVVFAFSEDTDHFTIDPQLLGVVLGSLARL